MGMFAKVKYPSSKETIVFGSRSESQFEKEVLAARAKRQKRVEKFFCSAPDQAKTDFLEALSELNRMLIQHATVSERLLIFIDNNVLQDILKREREDQPLRGVRFHALLAFLTLAEDHYLLDIFACVSPAVLYEAAYRGTRPSLEVFGEVVDALAEIGLATHLVGFSHPNELKRLFKRISRDEIEIRRALDEIKSKSWKRDFSGESLGTRIPFGVAEDECPVVRLCHFDPWYVKFLMMHIIEKRMYSENSDQGQARKLMQNPQERAFAILKHKGEGVEGLGDIELLTYCDLGAQTMRRSPHIIMGVTFDNSLREALWNRAQVKARVTIVGGLDDVADGALRAVYSMRDSQRRTAKSNRRAKEYDIACESFLETIRPSLTKAESSQA